MKKCKLILQRLKKPQVIMSILSQIVIILTLVNVKVDIDIVTGISTSVCSILVLLGVLSNPDDSTWGYCDEVQVCPQCKEMTCHVRIKDELICRSCGHREKAEPRHKK